MKEIQQCGGLWGIEKEGYCYALDWEQTSEGMAFYGDTPVAVNLKEQKYETFEGILILLLI